MRKKGFTLIELLGVIVVLAIIAIIVVPTILGIIEKARKSALLDSGNGLIEAGNLYNAQYQNANIVRFDIKDNKINTEEENKIQYKGNIKEGTVLVNNNGEIVLCINDGKYAAYKNFKDNKITIVDNKTCNIPENSNIVYLDNEATIDINIENLVAEINTLKQKVSTLENEKAGQVDVTNSITNLTATHNSDMSSINTRLEALATGSVGTVPNSIHDIYVNTQINISTQLSYTGISVTIPANSYFCTTATLIYQNAVPKFIGFSHSSTMQPYLSGSASTEGNPNLSTTFCAFTETEKPLYVWARGDRSATDTIVLTGYYISY